MFDVSWESSTSETVAQHRERKERNENSPAKGSRGSSLKSVGSSGSSKQNAPLFSKANNLKKASTPKRAISLLKNTKLISSRNKPSANVDSASPESQRTIIAVNGEPSDNFDDPLRNSVTDTIRSNPLSTVRSIATLSSRSSVTDNQSTTYEIQSLDGNSFITRSTEVTISPQNDTDVIVAPTNGIHISAEYPSLDEFSVEMGSDVFQFPRVPRLRTLKDSGSHTVSKRGDIEQISPDSGKPPEYWKPPTDWECLPDDLDKSKRSSRLGQVKEQLMSYKDPDLSLKTTHLQRHIRLMVAANPRIMLERMSEEWSEITDTTMLEELEFEKELWMLAALQYLSNKHNENSEDSGGQDGINAVSKILPRISKVLSLYESQASASFFAATSTASEVHHLATSPVPPSWFPNIHPLTVPIHHHPLPYATKNFSSIKSLSLPSVLASSNIPPLLRECNRILIPSGTLCLTVLDPTPFPGTLGPRFRTWLDKHLLLNLERNFRCMSPGSLLPAWLRDSGFSFKDESGGVTTTRFWAVPREDDDIADLTAVVGRMLWKEIWGAYVEGDCWWWEDDVIMEECERLETRWECAVVEAVKRQ